MSTFVLVPGAWHGGWIYKRVAHSLRRAGHEVYTPTLTGIGERSHLLSLGIINLSTHVQDIVNVIRWEDLDDVVLAGHSYAGMVISGVAEKIPERIAKLVYLNAIVPTGADQTVFEFVKARHPQLLADARELGGHAIRATPAKFFETRDPADAAWVHDKETNHPFISFFEGLTLTDRYRSVKRRFVYFADWQGGAAAMGELYARCKADPDWEVDTVHGSGHLAMLDNPVGLAEALVRAARGSQE